MPRAEPWRGQTARPTAALRLAQRAASHYSRPPPLARKLGPVTEMRPSCSTVERGIQCPGLSMPIAEPRTEIINMTSFNAERVARRHSCRLATVVGSLRLRPSSEQLDTARES